MYDLIADLLSIQAYGWVERAAKFAGSEVRSYIRSIRNTSLKTKCAGKFTVSKV